MGCGFPFPRQHRHKLQVTSYKLIHKAKVHQFDQEGKVCVDDVPLAAGCQGLYTASVGVFDSSTTPMQKMGEYHWAFECNRCEKSMPEDS